MQIKQIYEAFDSIGCLTFATVDENHCPQTRIAHLRGYDDKGIYFMTMYTKQFYRQLKENGYVSICGMSASANVVHDENGKPTFNDGYTIRLTGKVREVPMQEIIDKNNPIFNFCIADQQKYNAMVVFCIESGAGEIYDYDFTARIRENKLDRTYFAYNGASPAPRGLKINQDKCIKCGICQQNCSFKAISCDNNGFTIDPSRCDECGDCVINCPVNAVLQ
ncbi:MAG: 4Fe-4S binding protein [Bacillota bacterium]